MKMKKIMSVISATVMSGLCVVSNLTMVKAEEIDYTQYPLGSLEVSEEEENEFFSQFDQSDCSINLDDISSVPTSCDLSTNSDSIYFPPIGDQGNVGSCTAWATTYYQYSYAANKLNDVICNDNDHKDNAYSPAWTYNFINCGGSGSSWDDAYDLLIKHGALRLSEQPYNLANYDYSWSTDTSAMMNALKTRIKYSGQISITRSGTPITSKTDADLKEAKFLLSTGHVLVVSVSAKEGLKNWSFKNRFNYPSQRVVYRASAAGKGHAMAIVGYNDNICCDVNGNGKIEASERGAFKIANSWGNKWENNGFVWVMYDALNNVSANKTNNWEANEPGTRRSIFTRNQWEDNKFHYIEVDNYDVNLAGMLTFNTNNRYNFNVNLFRKNSSSSGYTDSLKYFKFYKKNDNQSSNQTFDKSFNGSLLFDYSEYADPVSTATNGYYFGVDVINISDSEAMRNLSYKIVDNKLNTVKNMPNIQNISIAKNRNKSGSVMIQCIQNDITYDNTVGSADLLLLVEYCIGSVELSNLQYYLADFNEDGEVNEADAKGLSRYIATHSSKNEVKKVMALNQRLTDYMKAHNYDKAEISEIEKLNDSISKEII